jgi:hypothetical protein
VGRVFVIEDAIVCAAVGRSVSGMEVVANRENSLAGRGGRHGERLKALVMSKAVGDPGKRPAGAREPTPTANVFYINRWGGLLKSACFRMARSFSSKSVLTRFSEKKRGFSVF